MRPSIDTVTAKILLAPVKYGFKRAATRCVCVTGVAFTKFCGRFVNGFQRLFNCEVDGWDFSFSSIRLLLLINRSFH